MRLRGAERRAGRETCATRSFRHESIHRRRILVIGHSATRWALEHLLAGRALEDLVDAPFDWQPGWRYRI